MADTTEAAAEGAAHAADGAESLGAVNLEAAEAGMPQLDIGMYPNLIFWLVVSLLLLYFILTRVALPRISSVLAERSDAVSNDLEQAQLLKRRADEAEAAYNAALAKARDEAHRIAAETKAEINRELSTLMAKADAEIAVKSAESEGRIAEIRESAVKSVEEVASATAREIVAAFMPGGGDDVDVSAAIANRMKG
jgi:F-type H+-transporting ATPase subunit b